MREILESAQDPIAYANHADYAGNTALHAAALKGHMEIVKVLVQHGANVSPVNGENETPMKDATDNDNDEIVDFLKDHGGQLVVAGEKPAKGKHIWKVL